MTFRRRHLHEDRLFECYLAVRNGEALDPRHAEHLADCDACAARYSELVGFMNDLQTAAIDETDAVFTADRLHAQRQAIAHRLAHVGRPARVISFPHALGGDRLHRPAASSRARWIAGAAAAGLFIGVTLGASFEWERHGGAPQPIVVERPVVLPAAVPVATDGLNAASSVATDDAFLSELETWADRPQTRELMPLDVLTPHVREIRDAR